jgi:ribonucleoside-diphosphate reductase beta chain
MDDSSSSSLSATEVGVFDTQRYVLFPIQHSDAWIAYKDQEASFWAAEEIDLTEDMKHYRDKLNDHERRLLDRVLGFFASSDKIVADNIDTNFIAECEKRGWLEATIAYQYQIMMENIHSEAYSKMIDDMIPDKERKAELFNFFRTVPSIRAKAEWCLKWMGRADRFQNLPEEIQGAIHNAVADAEKFGNTGLEHLKAWIAAECPTFGERLVAFVCVEAIFFSTSFAVIFWFKKRGLLPGICAANELISRDEGQHHGFGAMLLAKLAALFLSGDHVLGEIVPQERTLEIVTSCVELEKQFVRDALPIKLAGINEEKMCAHAEFVADRVLVDMGCDRHYFQDGGKDPCEWMESIGLHHKTNFFERRVTSYQRRGVKQTETSKAENTYRTDVHF